MNNKFDDRVKEIRAMAAKYRRVFDTPEGKEVFEDLMDRFYHGNMIGSDPNFTYANLGARSVLMHIMSMKESQHAVE